MIDSIKLTIYFFNGREIGTVTTRDIIIYNKMEKDVELNSIAGSTPHLHASFFGNKVNSKFLKIFYWTNYNSFLYTIEFF